MNSIDPDCWRQSLAQLTDPTITHVLLVQCKIDWLLPQFRELRDEIDEAVAQLAVRREGLCIRRIVLHNLPVLPARSQQDVAALNRAHTDWLYRLAACSALIPPTRRPDTRRLIVAEDQHPPAVSDCLEVGVNGVWSDPAAAAPALAWGNRREATPLTTYDINFDGPFGDSDPSIFL